jgi:copper chaperone NosL
MGNRRYRIKPDDMKALPRLLMVLAAIMLIFLYLFPIWRITLVAPQYPGGIAMYIWINKITGDTPGTLQNINILNHYVGMKFIVPDSIPELTYFPLVIIGMGILAIVFAILNKRWLFLVWGILFVVMGILGIYDFYLWEYDYGHNLSPTAPIKVPGMAYQPPVFGTKMLLNFKASSYPYWGSLFFGLSVILGFLAFFTNKQKTVV